MAFADAEEGTSGSAVAGARWAKPNADEQQSG